LRNEPGVEVNVVDGSRGELTVSLDGQVIADKENGLPTVDEVVTAVRNAQPHPTGV
jgi:hypothetical protein